MSLIAKNLGAPFFRLLLPKGWESTNHDDICTNRTS